MKLREERTTSSAWEVPTTSFPSLSGHHRAEVAVVGAGITGLTVAALLAQAGRRVIVVEASPFGLHGTTHRTSAHLVSLPDEGLAKLVRKFGREAAQSTLAATSNAIDLIEALTGQIGIDCDFRRVDGWRYTESSARQDVDDIVEEAELARSLGLAVELDRNVPLPFASVVGYRIARQGAFHPVRYLDGLARFVASRPGCAVFANSPVREFQDGAPCKLRTESGSVECHDVVLATHSPLGIWLSLHPRLVPYRSYCMAVRVSQPTPDGLFWDNANPYNYIRRLSSGQADSLVIGGADHKSGADTDTRQSFDQVERYITERFGSHEVLAKWSAELFDPADGLPYIGRGAGAEHVYVATGYSGCGLTLGTAAGSLITDLISGRTRDWADVVSPTRVKPVASFTKTAKEMAVTTKGLVVDRLFVPGSSEIAEIQPGEGRVVRHEGRSLAVCRDDSGHLTACSAICPHMGCVVKWNLAERTWDCPCHGSIFDARGKALSGPTAEDLAPVDIDHGDRTL